MVAPRRPADRALADLPAVAGVEQFAKIAGAGAAALEAPVLVVVGDQDALISPEEARALAASAPNGRAVVLEGAGHLPSMQQPDRFNAELLALVDELG